MMPSHVVLTALKNDDEEQLRRSWKTYDRRERRYKKWLHEQKRKAGENVKQHDSIAQAKKSIDDDHSQILATPVRSNGSALDMTPEKISSGRDDIDTNRYEGDDEQIKKLQLLYEKVRHYQQDEILSNAVSEQISRLRPAETLMSPEATIFDPEPKQGTDMNFEIGGGMRLYLDKEDISGESSCKRPYRQSDHIDEEIAAALLDEDSRSDTYYSLDGEAEDEDTINEDDHKDDDSSNCSYCSIESDANTEMNESSSSDEVSTVNFNAQVGELLSTLRDMQQKMDKYED
jgi:hypothetical protein